MDDAGVKKNGCHKPSHSSVCCKYEKNLGERTGTIGLGLCHETLGCQPLKSELIMKVDC